MLWIWLKLVLFFILRLFWIPPAHYGRRIDPNARCPVCGHGKGEIEARRKATNPQDQDGPIMVLHHCALCHFKWWESPVSTHQLPAM